MGLSQSTAPTIEPVSLAEAKLHARIDGDDDNALVSLWISAARRYCETATGRQLINASWTWKLPYFPASSEFAVPKPSLSSVTSIAYIDTAGSSQTLSSSTVYEVDTTSEPGRIALRYGQTWPGTRSDINAVTVIFVAGYGDAKTDVPETFRQAILLLVSHWNEHREAATELQMVKEVPMAVKSLLHSERMLEVG